MSLLSFNETACLSVSLLLPFFAFSFSSLPFILLYFTLHFSIFISISFLSLFLYLLLSFYLSVFASFSLSLSLSIFLLLFSFSPPLYPISKSSLPVGCAIKSPYESCFICCVTCCVLHVACCMTKSLQRGGAGRREHSAKSIAYFLVSSKKRSRRIKISPGDHSQS